MHASVILSTQQTLRVIFDPTNVEHLESLRAYVNTGSWGKVQFFAEAPYTNVPITVLMKYAAFNLGQQALIDEIVDQGYDPEFDDDQAHTGLASTEIPNEPVANLPMRDPRDVRKGIVPQYLLP